MTDETTEHTLNVNSGGALGRSQQFANMEYLVANNSNTLKLTTTPTTDNDKTIKVVVDQTAKKYTVGPYTVDFSNDKDVYNIGDQYMFGPAMMVCPVYQYKSREKSVHFPTGNIWYDLYDGISYEGGINKTVSAPYEKMPVFGIFVPLATRNSSLNSQ